MTPYICVTCGVQYAPSSTPPDRCPVCEDERQNVNWDGQQWTSLPRLQADHRNVLTEEEPGLTSLRTAPPFAIGQRALLVQSLEGNVLWDCVSLVDDATVNAVNMRGGLSAVAISHPHFYSSMVEWSRAFDGVPVYLHAADRSWVMRPDPALVFWEGERRTIAEGIALVRGGGHFDGSAMLHWKNGAGGQGVLLTGDTIKVAADRRAVSFMYSYPNHIPLPAADVRRIAAAVEPLVFDRIYGAWPGHVVRSGAKPVVRQSANRYLQALGG
jgi:hypothetical protein